MINTHNHVREVNENEKKNLGSTYILTFISYIFKLNLSNSIQMSRIKN